MGKWEVMKLLDKFEAFIFTEQETDYVMRAFLLIILVYIINLVVFNNSLIGSLIIVGVMSLYALYICLSVTMLIYSFYKKGDE